MQSGESSLQVQKAIFDALRANVTVTALVNSRVFDSIQTGTEYPYIGIGDGTAKSWDSATFNGMDLTVTIHSWSQARGRKGVKEIMKAVYDALHRKTLTMSGHQMIEMRLDYSNQGDLDPDGVTHHGIQRFRILTQGG